MKRKYLAAVAGLIVAGVAVLLPQAVEQPRPLSDLVPAGPLLYIEAKDFGPLVKQWNGSNEKKVWVASGNYQVFSRSRLFLRFADAQQEFAAAAGFAPDMTLVDAAAGTNSALALYDIGNLEFLYITRMPQARAYESMLWQSRAKFQPRKSAGIDYYVRQERQRTAAFAVSNDLLLIATEEEALASALALLAGQSQPAMKSEAWYRRATAAQATPGEVRMVLNLERVAKTPYFRSYWVQRNTRELTQFNAAISDLDRTAGEYRERRVLLRAEPGADARASEAAVGEISRFAPADAGLFRAWAKPEVEAVAAMISQKLIAPRVENLEPENRRAPLAGEMDATLGSEEDLETRIDEAPVVLDSGALDLRPLRALLEANPVQALLQVESSGAASDGVFVTTPRAIALLGARPWDVAAARQAVAGGFDRVFLTAAGRVLILASAEDLMTAMAGRASSPDALPGAQYAMRFLHARELPRFARMMTLIDFPALRGAGENREPMFFSENLASLGRTLGRVDSVFLESHDDGAAVTQSVVYRLQ
jgi:hypothetical protein